MVDSYLVNSNVFEDINSFNRAGINILDHNVHSIELNCLGFDEKLIINFNQFKIATPLNNGGGDIVYHITIPSVICDGLHMKMLTRLKENTEVGLSNLIYRLNKNSFIIKKTDIDYRNNLSLTSCEGIEIINAITDGEFVSYLENSTMINKMIKDKMKLFKLLTKSFVNGIINYTEYYRIKQYSYICKFKTDSFNLLNIFTYYNNGEKFVHVTFNMQRTNSLNDQYIRGYNFIL